MSDDTWSAWKAEVQALIGVEIIDPAGWGECFASGLTPNEAIGCYRKGVLSDQVKEYVYAGDFLENPQPFIPLAIS